MRYRTLICNKMLPRSFIIAIIIASTKVVSDEHLIEKLTTGEWWLTASGTNVKTEKPLVRYGCVTMYIREVGKCKCIFNNYEHQFHTSRIIKVHGLNERNETEIYSIGPVHEWNEDMNISLAAVMKSPFCWSSKFQLKNYTFTVMEINDWKKNDTKHLFLMGTYAKLLDTGSETHSALLTKEKIPLTEAPASLLSINELVTRNELKGKCPRMKIMCHECSTTLDIG